MFLDLLKMIWRDLTRKRIPVGRLSDVKDENKRALIKIGLLGGRGRIELEDRRKK